MIRDASKLQSISSYSQFFITTANCGTSHISGVGSVVLSNNLTLNSILVVPSLECNLFSVGQITHDLNCTVTLWPSFCVLQDILT